MMFRYRMAGAQTRMLLHQLYHHWPFTVYKTVALDNSSADVVVKQMWKQVKFKIYQKQDKTPMGYGSWCLGRKTELRKMALG
jgi:hypothetical protein